MEQIDIDQQEQLVDKPAMGRTLTPEVKRRQGAGFPLVQLEQQPQRVHVQRVRVRPAQIDLVDNGKEQHGHRADNYLNAGPHPIVGQMHGRR